MLCFSSMDLSTPLSTVGRPPPQYASPPPSASPYARSFATAFMYNGPEMHEEGRDVGFRTHLLLLALIYPCVLSFIVKIDHPRSKRLLLMWSVSHLQFIL